MWGPDHPWSHLSTDKEDCPDPSSGGQDPFVSGKESEGPTAEKWDNRKLFNVVKRLLRGRVEEKVIFL